MASMRDRLIHAYFGVDYLLVWTTIKFRLSAAKDAIRKMTASPEQSNNIQ